MEEVHTLKTLMELSKSDSHWSSPFSISAILTENDNNWVTEVRSAVKPLTEGLDTIVPTVLLGAFVYTFKYAGS
jgi:hypothetical protein